MAITDALLNFVAPGAGLSLVGAAGVPFRSAVIDLLGLGVGVAPQSVIGNSYSTYGAADGMGVGDNRLELLVAIGTALATANGATLNAQLQAAADTGAAGGFQPGTWNTIIETGAISAANLTAGTVFFRCPWLPPFPFNLRPRFLSLNFVVPAGENFTAGSIGAATVTPVRYDPFNKLAAKNFTVL